MDPTPHRAAFEKAYPLSVGAYQWVPPVFGVGALFGVAVIVPFVLLVIPFALALSLVPAWILGGRLLVHAEPGLIRLTRVRWARTTQSVLSFPPTEIPTVSAHRPHGHKPHGHLRASASSGQRELGPAFHDALAPIATDLTTYFGAPA